MKVLGLRHVGCIVNDLKKMEAFYKGIGLVKVHENIETGSFIDHLLGTDKIRLETVKMIIPEEDLPNHRCFCLELMRVIDTKSTKESRLRDKFEFKKLQGFLDIAFTVDNIQSVCDYIIASGGDVLNNPIRNIVGFPALHCYGRDPEGNVLHICQHLDT